MVYNFIVVHNTGITLCVLILINLFNNLTVKFAFLFQHIIVVLAKTHCSLCIDDC